MNKCHFQKALSSYLDNELSFNKRLIVEEHLKKCAICSQELSRLTQLSEKLKAWQPQQVSAGFERSVQEKIVSWELERGEEKMKKTTLKILVPSGVIAGILVLVLVVRINVQKTQVISQVTNRQVATTKITPAVTLPPATTQNNQVTPAPQQTQIALAPHQPTLYKKIGSEQLKSEQYRTYEPYYAEHSLYDMEQKSAYSGITGNYPPQSEFFEEEYKRLYDNEFQQAVNNPLSTFSIDVDTASYSNVRRFLNGNQIPPEDAVRIEELINYFTYDYPQPQGSEPFSVTTEVSGCPWNNTHKIALIGLQGKKIETKNLPASNLVFLIDVSGSMQDYNKLPLLKSAFRLLVNQLRPEDKASIVVYAGSSGVVLDSVSGAEKDRIMQAIDALEAGGSTAGAEGIVRAYELAKKNFLKDGNNRVILATDGDFNVGITSEGELLRLIEERRNEGIFLTVLGFGMGNYKDAKMEQLADKGNGNIAYIDNLLEAKKVFVSQLTGTLFTIAKDVKIQVEFNPAKVKAYRLIGYENRRLENRDFNDDKKDAGEMGAGHTVTALYEIVPAGSQEEFGKTDPLKYQQVAISQSKELLTVKLRYKEPNEDTSKLMIKILNAKDEAVNPSENFRFATSVAEFGLVLRNSQFKANASYQSALERAKASRGQDADGYRAEFIKLVELAQMLDTRKK